MSDHPVFRKDPADWMQYVYKKVNLMALEGHVYTGWVYTIDPVTESVVLVNFNNDIPTKCSSNDIDIRVVIGSSIKSITAICDAEDKVTTSLDGLFMSEVETFTSEEIEVKRSRLKCWLEKNRLPVAVDGDGFLNVLDVLTIIPPYGSNNCRSGNEIILARIQGLIKNMPDDVSM